MNAIAPAPSQNILFSNSAMGLGKQTPAFSYFERDGRRVMQVKDTAVFRSGTFRNSWGEQYTWGEEEMNLFVQTFDHLRAQALLPSVPVRKGHPTFGTNNMDGLIGYVTSLRTVKKTIKSGEFTFLSADYEILDSEAEEKIASGQWVNRAAEVGRYVSNDEVEYAPTFLGFAYVDIPAVEGLNQFGHKDADRQHFSMITEEVMPETEPQNTPTPVATPPAPTGAPAGQHAAPAAPQVHTFSIGGQSTSDYGQVQVYINGLESQLAEFARAERERVTAEREAFCAKLRDDNKILGSVYESTLAFAKGLSDEQYAAWKQMFEGAAAPSILQPHGEQNGEAGHVAPQAPADAEFSAAKQIVESLAKAGHPIDKVKKSESYAKVIAREPGYVLPTQSAYGQ